MRRLDLDFDAAQPCGGIDQILVELAAVGPDLLDLALERGLGLGRLALLLARGLELLVVLLERVELFGLVVLRRDHRTLLRRDAAQTHRQCETKPRNEREARIETAKPPNHFGQVTPAGRYSKDIMGGLIAPD